MNNIFKYQGYHFKPYKRLSDSEFSKLHKHLLTDEQLNRNNKSFHYEDFYSLFTDKRCDIFYCIETGKLYLLADSGLIRYIEKAKEKAKIIKQRKRRQNKKRNRKRK